MTDHPEGVTIRIDVDEISDGLRAMLSRLSNLRGFYKNVGKHMVNSVDQNFRQEVAPDGTPWQALSAARIKQRARTSSELGILRDTGDLLDSLNADATDNGVSIGVLSKYAKIHQFGGEVRIPGGTGTLYRHWNPRSQKTNGRFVKKENKHMKTETYTRKARTIRIPARPYLGFSPADREEIVHIAEQWLAKNDTP
ncbi:MAG: phage virion morphogenesis protein [Paracoccus sp. (in: a-proteobacteria)]|uniref:phage virion morphogenesis protein n=1 Tax=Paracoccus sp. TaxID=267 RepID=UPI0026E01CF2|nr:phage virion morphogenesis protein [Paracoccus sp. (in: a-proteobacteria)]MDO5614442.1 phage virion morphogenesis protein [Paracoccus sp. (in: a-proteobacteria)]